ncbi:MAG: hypothetical protein HQL80_07175 [Magnetococcales bacterium]|nr:hypothetical protein [Magnetococcales bacterium]
MVLLLTGTASGKEREIIPDVICREKPTCRLTLLAKLPHAPFPYEGMVGDTDQPFFEYDLDTDQRFHIVGTSRKIPEFPHFRDNRVLIHLPPSFQPDKTFAILVFFHGHYTEIRRTLVKEMALLQQANAIGLNLVLIAPQMALNTADSSPGKLYCRLGLARMLEDVSQVLQMKLGPRIATRFDQAPVILAAYSGGYRALAYSLDRGLDPQQSERLRGVVLLDALYGDLDKFDAWLQQPGNQFFVNLHGPSSTPRTEELKKTLRERGQDWSNSLFLKDKTRTQKRIIFLSVKTHHKQVFLDGPPAWPLSEILKKTAMDAVN